MKIITILLHSLLFAAATAVECDENGEPEGCDPPSTSTTDDQTGSEPDASTDATGGEDSSQSESTVNPDTVTYYAVLGTLENDPTFKTDYEVCKDREEEAEEGEEIECWCKIQSEGLERHPEPWTWDEELFPGVADDLFCTDPGAPTCCHPIMDALVQDAWMKPFPDECLTTHANRKYTEYLRMLNCLGCQTN